jgi:phosphohistidine phosphatase
MRLLLIRHGKAGDREDFARSGRPDDERPLTAEGLEEMRGVARGLAVVCPRLDVIASSPLTRAVQTADAVAARFPDAAREIVDCLRPDAPFPDFVDWLRGHRARDRVAAVGHNPHLSDLGRWLTGGDDDDADMKKGSARLLAFPGDDVGTAGDDVRTGDDAGAGGDDVWAGTAEGVWYRTPKELIALGR